ncbi:MAG TPA: efflux RND transporter periplasmic adaptor subunit [Candidatus Fermentibacter daniensis]|nr:MAG: Macrolide export protein MacA [candidate division Hyd24-12 bacterium ADurb.Bin004]HOZ16755.1 efflux RND transporter periplasmic adaptor subunit [Candidatus Fermentibacter daniensis]HPH38831.1 efflux RND transporter periplasmic adaptor subunit [Candidatus Fermentibacter daniensis]HPN61699.1 efflux RND transporter periplasmic adaptor subunit [Candidatus Fermentibacter daniensis]
MANRKKSKRWIWIAAAVVLAVVAASIFGKRGRGGTVVMAAVAGSGGLEERASGSGWLEGMSRVELSAEQAGIIDSIYISEGDTVSAGQILLTLDQSGARAAMNDAGARAGAARIARDQADRLYERMLALGEAGLASPEEVQQALDARQTAQAVLLQAYAAEASAMEALRKTSYSSPIAGVVTALNVDEGEMAIVGTMNTPGTVLLKIEDMSSFLVRVTLVESEVVGVRSGMPAEVTLDALQDTVFEGTVRSVGLAAENEAAVMTGEVAEYEVTIELTDTDPRLRSGMSASVDIITNSVSDCISVPVQCVVPRPDPADGTREIDAVLRIEGGRIEIVPVETGISGAMNIEVRGISEGDSVVSGPVEALRNLEAGEQVRTERFGGFGDRPRRR